MRPKGNALYIYFNFKVRLDGPYDKDLIKVTNWWMAMSICLKMLGPTIVLYR